MARKPRLDTKYETDDKAAKMGKRKKFTLHDLATFKPITDSQKDFFEAFYSDYPIIIQDGPAGTGKTHCAVYLALQKILDPATPQTKLMIVRSAVETRKQGFLPGTIEEKEEVFEAPYRSIINSCFKEYNESYDMTKQLGYYEFSTTSHMRGCTFDDTIVILDEAQNCDYSEASTVITRLGTNSQIMIIGDSNQNDLERTREKSGFDQLKHVVNNMPYESSKTITYKLEDIVRSGVVRDFLISAYNLGY